MISFRNVTLPGAVLLILAGGAMADASPASTSSSGIIALNSLPDPPTILATARVMDFKGILVGAVQKVVMDESGRPAMVDVALLGSGAVVQVDASKFNYDQRQNVLTTMLEAGEITRQPRAPQG